MGLALLYFLQEVASVRVVTASGRSLVHDLDLPPGVASRFSHFHGKYEQGCVQLEHLL